MPKPTEWFYYYGNVVLQSAIELPELALTTVTAPFPAITLGIKQVHESVVRPLKGAIYRHEWSDPSGDSCIMGERWSDGRYYLYFPGVTSAVISADGRQITLHAEDDSDMSGLRHILLDQILPRVLSLHTPLVVHGAMVITQAGRALVLLGQSGVGKSTLSSGFAQFGGGALGDDGVVIVLNDGLALATATYPGFRLWPDSLDTLFPDMRNDSQPMAAWSNKRRLSGGSHTHGQSHRIHGIAILQAADVDNEHITLQMLPPGNACIAIISNCFVIDQHAPNHNARQLAAAAQLCQNVPVFGLHYPRDYAALPAVIDAVSAAFDKPLNRTRPTT